MSTCRYLLFPTLVFSMKAFSLSRREQHMTDIKKEAKVPRNTQYKATTYFKSPNYINSNSEGDFRPFSSCHLPLCLLCLPGVGIEQKTNVSEYIMCNIRVVFLWNL